jgi:dephospho-CoA kinase
VYIGLIGVNGAGKSTVCDYFKDHGFEVLSLSDALRDYVLEKDLPLDRDTLTYTANRLKEERGLDVLAKLVFEGVEESRWNNVVFDSIRNGEEVSFLAEKGVVFVGVTADINIRYERIKLRARETDYVDFDTFKRQDIRETSGESTGQNIGVALESCQFIVENNTGLEDLHTALDTVLKEIKDHVST